MTAQEVSGRPLLFQRLRDGGVHVVQYNPLNTLAIRGKWQLINRDHRRIMVVDGKVAITGGVNIIGNYWTEPPDP